MISKVNTKLLLIVSLALLIIAHLIILKNIKFTLWPEMVVYPYLFNNNYLLYKDIINPYPPFLIPALAIFTKIVGYATINFKLVTWTLIMIIDILIYKISFTLTKNRKLAYLSVLFFIIFSIPFGINGLWFDLVQTPIILLSAFYFYKYFDLQGLKNLLISSILLAIAIILKQSAFWLLISYGLILVFKIKPTSVTKSLFYLIIPLFVIFIGVAIYMGSAGILNEFVFWSIKFPIIDASKSPGYISLPNVKQLIVILMVYVVFLPLFLSKDIRLKYYLLIALFLSLFLYPRFDYFHLIPALALLSIAVGPNIRSYKKSPRVIKTISVVALMLLILFSARYYLINSGKDIRFFERDTIEAAKKLELFIPKNELIYILNGPDQILPLAGILPLKPWIDEFPWYLELSNQQNRIVKSLIINNPKYILYKPYNDEGQFDLGSYRPEKIADYIDNNYVNKVQISDTLWLKIRK